LGCRAFGAHFECILSRPYGRAYFIAGPSGLICDAQLSVTLYIIFLGLAGVQALIWKHQTNDTSLWKIHSVEQYSTVIYLLPAASCVAIVFIVQNGFLSRRQIKLLAISIPSPGVFESLYGLVQYLGDYNFIWNFERIANRGLATGTFINRNNYALLMKEWSLIGRQNMRTAITCRQLRKPAWKHCCCFCGLPRLFGRQL
jgi:hypothetical protein